jgi:hypothetical protein
MKKLIITGFLLPMACIIYGQAANSEAVKHFLEKIHRAYDQAEKLSFHVQYRYANKSQPENYLDTLSGEIAMDKNRIRFVIGGTETIINTKYTIKVIEDEQLIYLTKVQRAATIDPVGILDTLLVKAGGGQASVVNGKQLNIKFPEGQQYRNISMTIDERTGLFQKVVYELYASALVSSDQITGPGKPAPYESEGRVEVIFSNYQTGRFNDSLFDEAKYFKRQGNYFEASSRYNGYRVFVASPTL